MVTNSIVHTILDNNFKNFHQIIGSHILSFLSLEKKKRSIIERPNGNIVVDAQLCFLYTQAQNHLFIEMFFIYLIVTQMNIATKGVIKLKGGKTRKNKKNPKKTKRKLKRRKIQRGGNSTQSLLIISSLLLLLFLKIHTTRAFGETSDSYVGAFKFKQFLELDPDDDQHMMNFTQEFGNLINRPQVKSFQTANLTKLFAPDTKASGLLNYFATANVDYFNKEVIAKADEIYNNNIMSAHKSLIDLCHMVIVEKSTDLSPITLGELFMKINETKKTERDNMLYETEQQYIDQVKQEVYQSIPTKDVTFVESASAAGSAMFNYFAAPSNELTKVNNIEDKIDSMESTDLLIQNRIDNELRNVLQYANDDFTSSIRETFNHAEENIVRSQNRRRYLENICSHSLKEPLFVFNQTEGILHFQYFPYSRGMIEVLLKNIISYTKQQIKDATDDDGFKMEKQIELAKYLQTVFEKSDAIYRKAIIDGHKGKKTLDGFISQINEAIDKVNTLIQYGVNGNPNERLAAEERMKQQDAKEDVEFMEQLTRERQRRVNKEKNEENLEDYVGYMKSYTDYVGVPLWNVYQGSKNIAQDELKDWIMFLLLWGGGGFVVACSCVWMGKKYLFGSVATSSQTNPIREPSRLQQQQLALPPSQREVIDLGPVLQINNNVKRCPAGYRSMGNGVCVRKDEVPNYTAFLKNHEEGEIYDPSINYKNY